MFPALLSGFSALFPSAHSAQRGWLLFVLGHILLIAAFFVALVAEASAQEIGATTYDFGPFIAQIIAALAPTILTAIGVVGLWVAVRLAKLLGLNINARHQATIERGLGRALSYGLEEAQRKVQGGLKVDLRNIQLVEAAAYAERHFPGTLRDLGKDQTKIREMLEARLNDPVPAIGTAADDAVPVSLRPSAS